MSDSNFLAPEQRYSRSECRSLANFKKRATVKSDSWKIPDISKAILNENLLNDIEKLKVHNINKKLVYIHQRCKIFDARKRATSLWVLDEYLKIYNEIQFFI